MSDGGHGERIARLEVEVESVMRTVCAQGQEIAKLQKLVTTMRIAWAGERVKIALVVAALGAVLTTVLAGAVSYVVSRSLPP